LIRPHDTRFVTLCYGLTFLSAGWLMCLAAHANNCWLITGCGCWDVCHTILHCIAYRLLNGKMQHSNLPAGHRHVRCHNCNMKHLNLFLLLQVACYPQDAIRQPDQLLLQDRSCDSAPRVNGIVFYVCGFLSAGRCQAA
jgi:hypothetical protein